MGGGSLPVTIFQMILWALKMLYSIQTRTYLWPSVDLLASPMRCLCAAQALSLLKADRGAGFLVSVPLSWS
jgi:hypothetical protein